MNVATAEPYRVQLRDDLEYWRSFGFGEEDFRWLEPEACSALVRTRTNLGGLYLSHCAARPPLDERVSKMARTRVTLIWRSRR